MPYKYGRWFVIFVFLIPIIASIFPSLFLFLWARGWFRDVSIIPPIYAYIGIYLCLILALLGIFSFVFVFVMIWRHRNDKDPIELLAEAMNKRFDRTEQQIGALQ